MHLRVEIKVRLYNAMRVYLIKALILYSMYIYIVHYNISILTIYCMEGIVTILLFHLSLRQRIILCYSKFLNARDEWLVELISKPHGKNPSSGQKLTGLAF